MKIGIFSDVHLNLWRYGATTNAAGINSRLMYQWDVLKEFFRYCRDREIREVVCTGDLFHSHNNIATQVLHVASESLDTENTNLTILAGNHDFDSKNGYITSLSWLEGRANVVTNDMNFTIGRLPAMAVAYTQHKSVLIDCLSRASGKLVFLHQGVYGEDVGNGFVLKDEVLTPDMIPDDVIHCFTGHYHGFSRVNDKLTIVGAMMPHNWGDVGARRGWLVYDTDTGEIDRVISLHPEFVVVDYCSMSSPELPEDLKARAKVNFVRVKNYTGDVRELRDYYRESISPLTLELDVSNEDETPVAVTERKTAISALNAVKDGLDSRRQEVAVEIVEDRYEASKSEHQESV